MSTVLDVLTGILAMTLAPAFIIDIITMNRNITKIYLGFQVITIIYALYMGYGVALSNIIAFALVVMSLMTIEDWEAKFEFKLISILVAEGLLVITCRVKIALVIILITMLVTVVRSMIKEWVSS